MSKAISASRGLDFETLFAKHYDCIFYWFLRRGLSREVAKELTQDTFLSAFKGHRDFRKEASTRTWIFRIARNIYKNRLRAQAAQKRAAPEVSLSARPDSRENDDTVDELEVADVKTLNPEDQVLVKERNDELYGSLEKVPSQMRHCVELRLRGLRYREIAEVMGVSIETVKSHLHQGRQRLRAILR